MTQADASGAISEADILCPLCEYNLRGLAEPRCPECGHRSTWEELRNRPPDHLYLFEHHPKRNVRSFARTLLGSLRPIRFWRSVSPAMRLRTGRVLVFGIICLLLAILSAAVGLIGPLMQIARMNDYMRTRMVEYHQSQLNPSSPTYDPQAAAGIQGAIAQYGSLEAYESLRYPPASSPAFWTYAWQMSQTNYRWRNELLRPVMVPLLWIPLTLLSLLVYRASMRQAKIRLGHVLRCVVYSATPIVLFGPLLLAASFSENIYGPRPLWRLTALGYLDITYLFGVAFLALLALRLAISYRLYLRFPHAIAAVIASQTIVALIFLKLDMLMQGH